MGSNVAASHYGQPRPDERFFLIASMVMVGVIIAGFTRLFLRGITTFAAPSGLSVLILAGLTTEIAGRTQFAGSMVRLITAGSPGALVDPFVQHLPPARD